MNETLESELTGGGLVYDTGLPAPPQDHLCIFRHFSGTLGIEIFQGNASTYFGRLRSLSSGFAEVRFLF
jgi:hypothetical protein